MSLSSIMPVLKDAINEISQMKNASGTEKKTIGY